MGTAHFIRITRIDQSPEIDLRDYPEVRGLCLVVTSDGTEIVVAWERPQEHDSAFLRDVDESVFADLDRGSIEVGLTNALDRIEHNATVAAAQAWTDAWVNAAVAAERG